MLDKKELQKRLSNRDAKIFVTSDLHFGHENIIKLADRPFTSVESMDEFMISQWNNVVSPQDVVFIVGDFCCRNKKPVGYYLERLNGTKILITGNHDKCGAILLQFDAVYRTVFETRIRKRNIVFSHYPMASWNGMFKNSLLFYGHVHKSAHPFEFVNLPNAHCVNVEFHNYCPIEISKIPLKNFTKEVLKNA